MASRPLKGSANYIWWEKDELGKGATATVYKCREKKTGDVYAVKVFSSRHRDRQNYHESTQQEREFSLLKKLKHENIVKMLSIEEETIDRPPSRVIVMEYCNGGSLYHILEKPINSYGLEEMEFLLFLRHITAGLRYLREQNVVHRDIKPGNIMKLVTSEGRSVYKLTDFGAARKLEEHEESFTSLYGTEEYLHPDLYDRAVLRGSSFGAKKSFTSSVDLWSVGVTIFHVATGSLPFRPYGGRRNKGDMQKILNGKTMGMISGVQEKTGGPIEYSDSLPQTCKLSEGLQLQIVPVIAGLLEVNVNFCSDFEKYFGQVSSIVGKTIVTVFDSCHCKLIKIYCDPKDDLRRMKELIDKQTGYKPGEQLLLYENSKLEEVMSDVGPASERFPITSDTNPVFLYHCSDPLTNSDEYPSKHFIPKFSRFGSAYDLEKDYHLAKICTGIMMYICGKVKLTLTLQNLLDKAVKAYEHYLIRMVVLLRDNILLVISAADEVRMRYSFMRSVAMLQHRPSSGTELSLFERLAEQQRKIEEMGQFIKDLQKYGEDYKEKLADRKELSHKWRRSSGCDSEKDMCYDKVASLTGNVESCMSEFNNDRKIKTLPYNEEQIHKFEKNKMSESCTAALSLLDDHCWDKTKKMYRLFIQWFQMAFRIQTKINKLKMKMDRLQSMQGEVSRELNDSDYELVRLVNSKTVSMSQAPAPAWSDSAYGDYSGMTSGVGSMEAVKSDWAEFESGFHELDSLSREVTSATYNLQANIQLSR